jgi:hypothetical protein
LILRYVYSTATGSKQLVGCVCRTDEGRLGYSAVHPKDRRKLTKKLARTIALGRAEKCTVLRNASGPPAWLKGRNRTFHDVPAVIVPHLVALV